MYYNLLFIINYKVTKHALDFRYGPPEVALPPPPPCIKVLVTALLVDNRISF